MKGFETLDPNLQQVGRAMSAQDRVILRYSVACLSLHDYASATSSVPIRDALFLRRSISETE